MYYDWLEIEDCFSWKTIIGYFCGETKIVFRLSRGSGSLGEDESLVGFEEMPRFLKEKKRKIRKEFNEEDKLEVDLRNELERTPEKKLKSDNEDAENGSGNIADDDDIVNMEYDDLDEIVWEDDECVNDISDDIEVSSKIKPNLFEQNDDLLDTIEIQIPVQKSQLPKAPITNRIQKSKHQLMLQHAALSMHELHIKTYFILTLLRYNHTSNNSLIHARILSLLPNSFLIQFYRNKSSFSLQQIFQILKDSLSFTKTVHNGFHSTMSSVTNIPCSSTTRCHRFLDRLSHNEDDGLCVLLVSGFRMLGYVSRIVVGMNGLGWKSEDMRVTESWNSMRMKRPECGVEVWSENDQKWESFLEFSGLIPMNFCSHIFACESNGCIYDVTRRYTTEWDRIVKKFRVVRGNASVESIIRDLRMNYHEVFGCIDCNNDTQSNDCNNRTVYETRDELLTRRTREKCERNEFRFLDSKETLPGTESAFRKCNSYILRSHIKSTQKLHPNAVPIALFKSQPVYLRADVSNLRSRMNWRRFFLRDVCESVEVERGKEGAKDVYAEWDTEAYDVGDVIDGIVPRNEYGNIEVWSTLHVPRNGVYIEDEFAVNAAKRIQVDAAPAVIGFEMNSGFGKGGGAQGKGAMRSVVKGAVVCKCKEGEVRQVCDVLRKEYEKKQEEERKEEMKSLWKSLFKAAAARLHVMTKYGGAIDDQAPSQTYEQIQRTEKK